MNTTTDSLNPHLDQPVIYAGQPITSENPVILALHGRGQTTDFVLDVFTRLGWQTAALVAPAAAEQVWYPGKFMEPFERTEPQLSYALERIDQLVRVLLARGVRPENLYLLGFSQGACLAAEYAVRNARRYGGVMIFTGGVIGPPGTRWDYAGMFDATPVLVTTGDPDSWVPVGRVYETIEVMLSKGAAVTAQVFAEREHEVSDAEIDLARRLFISGSR